MPDHGCESGNERRWSRLGARQVGSAGAALLPLRGALSNQVLQPTDYRRRSNEGHLPREVPQRDDDDRLRRLHRIIGESSGRTRVWGRAQRLLSDREPPHPREPRRSDHTRLSRVRNNEKAVDRRRRELRQPLPSPAARDRNRQSDFHRTHSRPVAHQGIALQLLRVLARAFSGRHQSIAAQSHGLRELHPRTRYGVQSRSSRRYRSVFFEG